MRLLVAGAVPADAGKTTFAVGLLAHADAVGIKPRAGNDVWYDHDDVREAVADGRLYGKDARRLAAAGPGCLAPEDVNPVHRLWRPAPGPGTGILGREDREFVVDRAGDRFVRNAAATVPDVVREALPVEEALAVDSLAELNEAMERFHLPAQADLLGIVDDADRVVVESYGDVARPTADLAVDAVAVVEPARARIYRGDRYARACRVAPGGDAAGTLETRVAGVVDLLEPATTATLPTLSGSVRSDPAAVAAAYGDVYDRLLAVAGA